MLTRLLLLVLAASLASGTTYEVAPNGDDAAAGTPAAPLRTLSAAARRVQPGDTVVVRPGLYRESVRLTASGTPTQPITWVAEPAGQAVISGADPLTGWRRLDGDQPIWRIPWPHRFVINTVNGRPIEHHPSDAPVWGRAEQVIAGGAELLPAASLAELRSLWQQHRGAAAGQASPALAAPVRNLVGPFAGRFFADTSGQQLYCWLADGGDPNVRGVEACSRGQLFGVNPWQSREGVAFNQVRGFVFRFGATFPQRPAVWLHGRDNLLEDCLVERMAGGGVVVHGAMRRCLVRGCGHVGGGARGDGFLNEDCRWEGNSWKPISRGWDAGGFKMAQVNGGVFRRCHFRRNGGPGLWLDIHVRNVLVSGCVFEENEGSGLFIEISRDIQAVGNLAVGNATGVVGAGEREWGSAGILVAESMNCLVAHNTCVGNKDGVALREQGPRLEQTTDFGPIPYHLAGNVVSGNVCALNRGYQLAWWYDNAFFGWHPAEREKYQTEEAWRAAKPDQVSYDPTAQGHLIDRNLLFAGPDQKLVLYGAPWRPRHQEFTDLASFAAATGFQARGLVADPGLADLAKGDYRLQPDGAAAQQDVGWRYAPSRLVTWLDERLPTWTHGG